MHHFFVANSSTKTPFTRSPPDQCSNPNANGTVTLRKQLVDYLKISERLGLWRSPVPCYTGLVLGLSNRLHSRRYVVLCYCTCRIRRLCGMQSTFLCASKSDLVLTHCYAIVLTGSRRQARPYPLEKLFAHGKASLSRSISMFSSLFYV